jgi:hypothetical protein
LGETTRKGKKNIQGFQDDAEIDPVEQNYQELQREFVVSAQVNLLCLKIKNHNAQEQDRKD